MFVCLQKLHSVCVLQVRKTTTELMLLLLSAEANNVLPAALMPMTQHRPGQVIYTGKHLILVKPVNTYRHVREQQTGTSEGGTLQAVNTSSCLLNLKKNSNQQTGKKLLACLQHFPAYF